MNHTNQAEDKLRFAFRALMVIAGILVIALILVSCSMFLYVIVSVIAEYLHGVSYESGFSNVTGLGDHWITLTRLSSVACISLAICKIPLLRCIKRSKAEDGLFNLISAFSLVYSGCAAALSAIGLRVYLTSQSPFFSVLYVVVEVAMLALSGFLFVQATRQLWIGWRDADTCWDCMEYSLEQMQILPRSTEHKMEIVYIDELGHNAICRCPRCGRERLLHSVVSIEAETEYKRNLAALVDAEKMINSRDK